MNRPGEKILSISYRSSLERWVVLIGSLKSYFWLRKSRLRFFCLSGNVRFDQQCQAIIRVASFATKTSCFSLRDRHCAVLIVTLLITQDLLWWGLYKAEPLLQGSQLRKKAIAEAMDHIHYEVRYLKQHFLMERTWPWVCCYDCFHLTLLPQTNWRSGHLKWWTPKKLLESNLK